MVCSVLAMGLGLTGAGYPYRLLYDYAPGWDGVRVPGRVFTLATLFYALLAGAGAQWLTGAGTARGAMRHSGCAATACRCSACVLLIGPAGRRRGPSRPPGRAAAGAGGDRPARARCWTCRPTARRTACGSTSRPMASTKIPIGNSTFDIPQVDDLRGGMSGFPDRASVEKLRYYGIRTVVLHLTMPTLPGIARLRDRRAAGRAGGRGQAGRGPGRHAPPGGHAGDLRNRPGAGGAARERRSMSTPPAWLGTSRSREASAPLVSPAARGAERDRTRRTHAGSTPGAGGDPAGGPGVCDADPELLVEPDLPLRPDPRAERGHGRRSTPTRRTRATRRTTRATATPRARPGWRCSRCRSTTR